jgi:hypothetical protein
MAGIFRAHNKFHRSSHHTLSSYLNQDQGTDPIASYNEPFNGIFYNTLTDQIRSFNINTNSYEWYSTYSTVSSLSSNWDSIKTVYTTVYYESGGWGLGYNAYLTLKTVSANYDSTYTTICANSALWGDSNLLYTNRVQQNTRSKTFSGYTLSINGGNVDWDLDIAQVAFLDVNGNVTIKNPPSVSMKRGGIYTLYVKQINGGGWSVNFDTVYKFPVGTVIPNDISQTPNGVTVLNFLCDGSLMFGDLYKTQL